MPRSQESQDGSEPFIALLKRALEGTYRIERELGGGAMARVFLADEHALGRRVVIKVLSPELAHELSAERFAREIRLLAQLQHPNIVPILTAGIAGDVPYYTMPFIEGESLRAYLMRLDRGERLPATMAVEVLRDVARALAYAHAHDVVHRDIKPENILLAYDAAVVADFGVAKAMSAARAEAQSAGRATLTQVGMALGTPAYMSPEQAAGDPVDQRADVYAWGILAYELLAGAHPFEGHRSVQALVAAHLVEEPRPLSEVMPNGSPALAALVMRCLAKNADERVSDGRAIMEGMASAVSDEHRESRATRATVLPTRGRRVVAASVGAVGILTLAAVAWTIGSNERAAPEYAPATTRASAYEAYLRGNVRVSNENRQDNDAAIQSLREAVAGDPTLAPAHAALARAFAIKAFYFTPDSQRVIEDAEVAVAKALSLDSNLGEAHFARALLLWTPARRFPHDQAVRAYRRAVALDSTLDEAHHQLALVLLHVGLFDQARAELERALAINPSNTLARFRFGVIDLYRGEFERAYAIFRSTPLERLPSLWTSQTATALFRLGREVEATAMIDRFLREYPQDEGGVGSSVKAMLFAKGGRREEALAAIATSIERGKGFGHFHHAAYNIASSYALLGENAEAIRWIQNAADDGFPCYPLFAADALLDGLRRDPRFLAVMERLRRDWEERTKTF